MYVEGIGFPASNGSPSLPIHPHAARAVFQVACGAPRGKALLYSCSSVHAAFSMLPLVRVVTRGCINLLILRVGRLQLPISPLPRQYFLLYQPKKQ